MRRKTPMQALLEGLVAGVVGAGVQTLFFKVTKRLTPETPRDVFSPPEPIQKQETATETIARRLVEQLTQRGPLDEAAKRRGGEIVHWGFGAAWGGLYGLLRASYPSLRGIGGLGGFSLAVWLVGDELLLPLFRVAAWPHKYPLRLHAYAAAAHLAYGAGMGMTFALAERGDVASLGLMLLLSRGRAVARRTIDRSRALVPKQVVEGPRHLAAALARRAHDLH
jgi:hypothetical protein